MLALTLVGGCAASRSSDLTGFGNAAGALAKQADATFLEANSVGRTAAIEDFVRSGRPGLNERQIPPLVPSEVASAWAQSLLGLQRYGLLLGSLSDEQHGADTTTALKSLGAELGGIGAGVSPGVASGFAELGGALVNLRAQRRVREVLRETDPHVQTLLHAMAEAVGSGPGQGLTGTVASAWMRNLTPLQNAYALAAERHDEQAQRATVAQYLAGLAHRDVDLRTLASFRASLLALADAHAAASAGSQQPFGEVVVIVEERLGDAMANYDELRREQTK